MEVNLNGQLFVNKNGTWVTKSNIHIPFKKQKSEVKSQYRDKPQYKVQYSIEDKFKKDGYKMLKDIGVQIVKTLIQK